MKKILIMMAAVLTLAACDKEKVTVNESAAIERDIFYTVSDNPSLAVLGGDGVTTHLSSEAEWEALLDQFCEYARSGEQVMFCSTRHSAQAKSGPSNVPTSITTSDREELKAWMKAMEAAGKTVIVNYDDGTGTWNGMAYANMGPNDPQAEAQTYSGVLAFVPTPAIVNPPMDGTVMALQVDATTTYIITVHGMMIWFDGESTSDIMELLQGSQATFTGVAGTYTDLNGSTFLTLDLEVSEDGVIEF